MISRFTRRIQTSYQANGDARRATCRFDHAADAKWAWPAFMSAKVHDRFQRRHASSNSQEDVGKHNRVKLNVSKNIATITLCHPQKRNALSIGMLRELSDCLSDVTKRSDARVVVLRSSSANVFSSGHDLNELAQKHNSRQEMRQELTELFYLCSDVMLQVHEAPQPVIAEVSGIATAAGCQLVASCDLAVASDVARFATPGVNIGLFCSTPAVPLVRTVSPKHAMEMLLLGDFIDAQRAHDIGLINTIVPLDELSSTVNAMATQIASKSVSAIRIGKKALRRQVEMGIHDAYSLAGDTMVDNMMTYDASEGISGFLEKRKPDWRDA